jgi:hypothetical protein
MSENLEIEISVLGANASAWEFGFSPSFCPRISASGIGLLE